MYHLYYIVIVVVYVCIVISLLKNIFVHKDIPHKIVVFICIICVSRLLTDGILLRTITIARPCQKLLPIGSGWSFYLDKGRRQGQLFYTRFLRGKLPNQRYGSGTFIKEVQNDLRKCGMTLFSYPSIENGTLGGWIASGSHGSGGNLWKSSFGQIKVWDTEANIFFETDVSLFGKQKSIHECRKYIILEVEVHPHEDVYCSKYAFKINTKNDCDHFLNQQSYLRIMQLGQRGKMGLLWMPYNYSENERKDPYFASQISLYLQADILSVFQNSNSRHKDWFDFPVENSKNFVSKIKLSDANKFTVEPPLLLTPIGLLYNNFEFFIFVSIDAQKLHILTDRICDLFTYQIHGRCELRCGSTILFLDFVLSRKDTYDCILDCIHEILGSDVEIRLHRGKYQIPLSRD